MRLCIFKIINLILDFIKKKSRYLLLATAQTIRYQVNRVIGIQFPHLFILDGTFSEDIITTGMSLKDLDSCRSMNFYQFKQQVKEYTIVKKCQRIYIQITLNSYHLYLRNKILFFKLFPKQKSKMISPNFFDAFKFQK